MSKFSNDLCFCFPEVSQSADSGVQLVKDVSAFVNSLAKAEESYAAQVSKLCAAGVGASFFSKLTGAPALDKETKTLKDAITSMVEQTSKVAEAHAAAAKKCHEDVCKLLDEFAKKQEAEKKSIQQHGSKLQSELQGVLQHTSKTTAAYQSASKAADAADAVVTKAKEALANAPDDKKKKSAQSALSKAESKAEQAAKKVRSTEKDNKAAIDRANEYKSTFSSKTMPPTLDSFQKAHEERFEQLVSALKYFAAAKADLPAAYEDGNSHIKEKAESHANLDEDLQEFIEKISSESKDSDIVFEASDYTKRKYEERHGKEDSAAPEKKEEEEKKEEKKEEPKKDDGNDDDEKEDDIF